MNVDAIHLRQLAYVVAVAEHGSFGDAADALGVSQPALSQGLARLEALIGAPLFEADGRRRRFTPLGAEVAAQALRVVGETRNLGRLIDRRLEGTAGSLRVGMIDAAVLSILAAGVERYRTERPEVSLHLTVGDSATLLAQLRAFDLDLAYVVGPVSAGASAPIATEELFIYGPPLPDDLGAMRWVLYPAGSKTRAAIDGALASLGAGGTVVGESGNPRVLRQLVYLGMGWTVLPADVAETGRHALERRSDAVGSRTIHAVWRDSAGSDPVVGAFRRTVEPDA